MYTVLNITKDHDANNSKMSSNLGHEELDFYQSCKLAKKHGFKGINIDLEYPKYSATEMKFFLNEFELKPVSFHLTVKLEGTELEYTESLKRFKQQAKMAEKIGCFLALKYIPPFSEKLNFDKNFRLYMQRLNTLKNILVDHNIKIAFEFIGPAETRINSKFDFIHTIDGVRSLISASDIYDYAGFKLDIHHWQHSGAALLDLQHLDIQSILYLELNDGLIGYSSFNMPEFKRKLPLQTGVNDVKGFLTILKQKGYLGPVAVEPWDIEISELPLEEAIFLAKKSLDDSFAVISN
ncbi:TIM barrel protein [Pigmentibacter sp. JX0631]|uniref:sugar phosphate isomerase/epimerase family protein n=1 Tax=Pigmentibacter sp. JX0631 TaxID=2976982 RepID=UPI002468B38C|nr:TIM barrel protein [Pigmentibacter sp. JX0631]WGL58622.1 TIM barrel protein [Pigmentibacter sp. JX0631]